MLSLLVLVAAASPVLVLDPIGEGVGAEARAALGAKLVSALGSAGVADVVGQDDLRSLVDAEARRQSTNCDEASCAAEIAEAFGADRAIASRVVHIGGAFIWQLILVDARAGRVLARSEATAANVDGLYSRAGAASAPLARALGAAPLPSFVWPVSLAAAAVAVAASGLAFDLLSSTSQNGTFDAADAIGPTAYVAAAGLGAAAFFNPMED